MRKMGAWCCVALVVGCGSAADTYMRGARTRGANELSCPQDAVTSRYLGSGGVEVRGCGQMQNYTCTTTIVGQHRDVVCRPDGPPTGTHIAVARPGGAPPSPGMLPGETEEQTEIRRLLASCELAPGTAVSVAIGAPGDVLRIDPSRASGSCSAPLRAHTFGAQADAYVVTVTIPASVTPAPPPPTATAPVPDVDANVRAMIAQRRDSILLCNGGAATAVVGEWTAEGALTIRLPDARAGSAEDGCVRATAAGARIEPAPGVSGSLLHPVQ